MLWHKKKEKKKAVYIQVNKSSLNKVGGRYKLPRVFHPILESSVQTVTDL